MENCVFCNIKEGKTPASMVYSDEKIMAFMDIQPVNPGHVLVVPRVHVALLSELDEEIGTHMFRIAMRIDNALRSSGIRCEGVTLYLADGEAAFQEIPHVHLHVIPRFSNDSFRLKFGTNYSKRPSREELDSTASKIKGALNTATI